MNLSNQNESKRILVLDALRGFALAGIVLVHMLEQYTGGPVPEAAMASKFANTFDSILEAFVFIFFRGKFIALFSILFGLSFYIQMQKGSERGGNYQLRFLWRLALLFGFGMIHHLIYRGDILSLYAMIGIFLIPFERMNAQYIMAFALVLIVGTGTYITLAIVGDQPVFGGAYVIFDTPEGKAEAEAYWTALSQGSFRAVALSNLERGFWMKMEYHFGVNGRTYQILAYFLIGLALGKTRLIEKIQDQGKLLWRGFFIALGVLILGMAGITWYFSMLGEENMKNGNIWFLTGLNLVNIWNLIMTGFILSGFLLIYRREGGKRALNYLAPYGRTALSNYMLQSILGALILYHWGFGRIGQLNNLALFGIALIIIALQVFISHGWLKSYNYGPLEWLWRSMTLFNWQKMRKAGYQKA